MAKEKRNGLHLSDHDHHCLTHLRFADDVLLFATSKEQIRKMICEFKIATEKVGLRMDTKKQLEVDDMKIEILTRNESVKYLGQKISFYQQETTEIKSRIRAAWATFHQIQTRVDTEKLHAQTPSTAIRRRSISNCMRRSEHMGT